MKSITKSILVGGGILVAGWIGWGLYSGRTVETLQYKRQQKLDNIELRQYPQTIRAETTAPNQRVAFRRLFNYISGANHTGESLSMTAPVKTNQGTTIDMTAPVRSETETDRVQMAFYLPTTYTPETAPEPTAPEVTLHTEPAKTVAVTQFSWYALQWRVKRQTRKLLATLAREGIDPVGDPYLLRYDDPGTPPFLRRNEIAVAVTVD